MGAAVVRQMALIHGELERQGVVAAYRTLHRFATEQCGFGAKRVTVRVADGARAS